MRVLRLLPAPGHPEGYTLTRKRSARRSRRRSRWAASRSSCRAGIHPYLKLEWYEELLRDMKSLPRSTSTASARPRSSTSPQSTSCACTTCSRGWRGGARLDPRRRRRDPRRPRPREHRPPQDARRDEWLEVMESAHAIGMKTTATMMFGHVETLAERVEHLKRLRAAAGRERGGFTAFICWTLQPDNTEMAGDAADRRVRVSPDARRRADVPRQLPEHAVLLGHAGRQGRPDRAALRRERHGQPDDRGERRRARRARRSG